jgi:hypothetical protein
MRTLSFHRRNKKILASGVGISLLLGIASVWLPQTIILRLEMFSTNTSDAYGTHSLRNQDEYEQVNTNRDGVEQRHSTRTTVVTTRQHAALWDLLPWEEASRSGQCKGPTTREMAMAMTHHEDSLSSLQKTTEGNNLQACCPGALSAGGGVRYNGEPSKCYGDMFDRVADDAKTYLAREYNSATTTLRATGSRSPVGNSNDDYTACDACRIMDLLILHNWTLSFSGDSMLRQNFVGLQCEIMRRISSETINNNNNNNNNSTTYRIKILPRVNWPRDPEIFWRRGVHSVDEVQVYHSANNNNNNNSNNNYARLLFFANYRPLDDNNTELEYIAQQSDIIVFDHGLHYLPQQYKDMVERTRSMLQALAGGNDVKLVAWRETSSQHFNTSHGEYMADVSEHGCHPIRHAPAPGKLRSDHMVQAAKQINWTVAWANDADFSTKRPPPPTLARPLKRGGPVNHHHHQDDSRSSSRRSSSSSSSSSTTILGELVILPFRKFTHDLHYAHGTECTHYCSSPHLWLPVWRALRLSMDRLFL